MTPTPWTGIGTGPCRSDLGGCSVHGQVLGLYRQMAGVAKDGFRRNRRISGIGSRSSRCAGQALAPPVPFDVWFHAVVLTVLLVDEVETQLICVGGWLPSGTLPRFIASF